MAKSDRQDKELEETIEKKLSGRLTCGSGNKYDDGDIKTDLFLVECKHRNTKSFTIKDDELQKIRDQAARLGRLPLLINRNITGQILVTTTIEDFLALIDTLEEKSS